MILLTNGKNRLVFASIYLLASTKRHHSVNFQNMKFGNIRFVGNLIGDIY